MKNIIRIISFALCLVMIPSLVGCAGKANAKINWYDYNAVYKRVNKTAVAENELYSLLWDAKSGCVTLYDKANGIGYSNVPKDALENTSQPVVYSPIVVNYIESDTLNTNNVTAYAHSIKSKDFSAETIKDGIRVTYYFKKVGISVPVNYTLRNDSLQVSIVPDDIGEDEQYCYSIDMMPFFCSVLNKDTWGNSYLFVPSGSGALIYPKILGEGITSIISNQVYGRDDVVQDDSATDTENIYLPVYGAKNGDSAICAIIENSSETASITTNVGSSTYGYSAVYSSFNIRGSEVHTTTLMGSLASKKTLFCKGKTTDAITVGFYPLYGDDANYVGMAKTYQNYLVKNDGLSKKKTDTQLNLNYIGGTMAKSFFAGIPYDKLCVLTKFSDVKKSVEELSETYDGDINVKLTGFGSTGCDIEKIGGAFKYNGKFGNIKTLNDIKSNGNVNTYFNFDILHFEKSGNGVTSFSSVARSAIGRKNVKRDYTVALHETDWLGGAYWVVKRDKLNSLANKAISKTSKWKLDGISFDTLTYRTYSDYTSSEYYAKSGFSKQTKDIIEKANDNDLRFSSTGANAFATVLSNQVFNTPTQSAKYNIFDADVPFYQLVFKGYISLSVHPINFASDREEAFLKAVETGSGLGYTLINTHNTDVFSSKQNSFYSAVYDDNKDEILKDLEIYKDLFDKVSNVEIENFETEDSVHITTFKNGIRVYTNFGTENVQTEFGELKSNGFVFGEVQ